MLEIWVGEIIGTLWLLFIGTSVCCNISLSKTKGNNGGWLMTTTGWAFAVTMAIFISLGISGAHLNPAVSLAQCITGDTEWNELPVQIVSQCIGSFIGAFLTQLLYLNHFNCTDDKDTKLGVFCTAPAIRHYWSNLLSEILGTFVLVVGDFTVGHQIQKDFSPYYIGIIVWVLGISIGGTTGYAINPSRDLMPRILHSILPIKNKRDSDWKYSWVPIVGPMIGGVMAAIFYKNFLVPYFK